MLCCLCLYLRLILFRLRLEDQIYALKTYLRLIFWVLNNNRCTPVSWIKARFRELLHKTAHCGLLAWKSSAKRITLDFVTYIVHLWSDPPSPKVGTKKLHIFLKFCVSARFVREKISPHMFKKKMSYLTHKGLLLCYH